MRLTSKPLKVLLASSSRAHNGEEGVVIPFLAAVEPVTFSRARGGHRLATDFFTEGLFKISSILKGVRGLFEFAGGGSWSNGPRLLSSPLDCNTDPAFMSLLEVIAVPGKVFQQTSLKAFNSSNKRPRVLSLIIKNLRRTLLLTSVKFYDLLLPQRFV